MAVQARVDEGRPHLFAVAGHRVVETAVAQQAEIGHPQVAAGRACWPARPPAAQQVGSQAVDGLHHGQSPQGGLHPPGGGGPRRMLVSVAVRRVDLRRAGHEGRTALTLPVQRMPVVQAEATAQFRHRPWVAARLHQDRRPGLLPGRGMRVAVAVEQVHRPTGQKPPLLPSFRHAPSHRRRPFLLAQPVQHPPDPGLVHVQDGRQVGHTGQGHQAQYPEQATLLVTDGLPERHIGTSTGLCGQNISGSSHQATGDVRMRDARGG